MVQRTGQSGEGTILFVQNNFYYDAFFLKALGEFFVTSVMPYLTHYRPP